MSLCASHTHQASALTLEVHDLGEGPKDQHGGGVEAPAGPLLTCLMRFVLSSRVFVLTVVILLPCDYGCNVA
ncbi:hypothetical protein DPEC_G00339890 [Dallia pectoralis]|uniref:Uncharacterized protein n=1 Tax=Dallia pectoralis TaxID=75939 RepID=A0ACC2F4X9_DALPE|nr:hypothetical protein DPEC_G00339890 [Dallia pectoralis]